MKRIAVKVALFFIAIICIASILSFLVSILFTNSISTELRQNQAMLADAILELRDKTDLSLDEIIGVTSGTMYEVSRLEQVSGAEVTPEELARAHRGEVVHLPKNRFHGSATLFIVDDALLLIRLQPHNTIYRIVASRVWFTLLSLIIIGALLIALFVNKVVGPVLKLTWATQEVAKGNFDIQLEHQSNDEVGQLTENFNKMTRELKGIEYLRKDFITSVSHEFKTPLASIQGFAKLLQKGDLSAVEVQEYTNIIVEEAGRLSNLSSNILKLSKLENQEIVGEKAEFSLDEQIRRSILLLEHAWSRKELEFDLDLARVEYRGDEELLEQVWLNLISNAIKFSHPRGRVGIGLWQNQHGVTVEVRDQGIGMDTKTQARIFEKFFQGDQAHSQEGSGLGLSLVKRILDLHGGKIHVESKTNEGSVFILELPL